MKSMKSYLFPIIITILLVCISGYISLNTSFGQYQKIQHQIREYPHIILSPELVQWASIGNKNTAADLQWVSLIQYIGSNIGGSTYLDFSHTMIDSIITINPYFIKPYEWALLLTPMRNSSKPLSKKQKTYIERATKIGSRGIATLCDKDMLTKIKNIPFHPDIFQQKSLQNFCLDAGMIAYYLGFQYAELDNMQQSRYYYTIAGLQNNTPTASQILAVLASPTYDQRQIAQKFLLMAASTPLVPENEKCIETSIDIIEKLKHNPTINREWITQFELQEKSVFEPKKSDEPIQYCFPFFGRAAKQLYQAYVTEVAKSYPEAKTGKDLIASGALDSVPQSQTQTGFLIRKREHNWQHYK